MHLLDGKKFIVKGVLAVDGEGDLAMLQVDVPAASAVPLPIDRSVPQEGESIVVVGKPVRAGRQRFERDRIGRSRDRRLRENNTDHRTDIARVFRFAGRQHGRTGDRHRDTAGGRGTEPEFRGAVGANFAVEGHRPAVGFVADTRKR